MDNETVQLERRMVLERAIERSGLSARRYAYEVLLRDPRTVYRWLNAERPVPKVVSDRLAVLELEREK